MKEKIISKATDMFLKLGFKSVTMDDIAGEMCISKKTIYKFFCNKEVLISEATDTVHQTVNEAFKKMTTMGFNPIEENFEIRKYFKGIMQSAESSPLYQLRKHYPDIYESVISKERNECFRFMQLNVERGISAGYYREDTNVENVIDFFYTINFHINGNTALEKDAQAKELAALVYHTRAIATPKGLEELEKQLSINT